ncbi:MAG: ribbon-helix-helix domain-containing protein [archaeon]
MKRVQIYLTDQQINKLEEKVENTGLSRSEIIRRIIDNVLNQEENNKNELNNN